MKLQARRFEHGRWQAVERVTPEEAPVVMTPNGAAFAAVMASPADLEELAVGFAVTEGIVESFDEIEDVSVHPMDEGFEAALTVPPARAVALAERRRAFAARTSCSLCGFEDFDLLLAARPGKTEPASVAPEALIRAMAALAETAVRPGVHAAAWAGTEGALMETREDVGRHNALDKLIGARLMRGRGFSDGVICLTSRCSIEMVLKAARVGASIVASAGSPTALAVQAAEAAGIALVAGARDGALEVYAGLEGETG